LKKSDTGNQTRLRKLLKRKQNMTPWLRTLERLELRRPLPSTLMISIEKPFPKPAEFFEQKKTMRSTFAQLERLSASLQSINKAMKELLTVTICTFSNRKNPNRSEAQEVHGFTRTFSRFRRS
jgi:hypothetical protein